MSLAASAANAQGRAVSDEFGPILARTRTVLIPVGPLACDGIKLIFVRAGSAILFSKSGDQRVNFGDVVLLGQNTLSGGEPDDWITVTTVTLGWRGETHDAATGLIWLRARWYDPATARFLSADPWHGDPSNPISLNRYVYGNADPVNMHDPTGRYATGTYTEQAATMSVANVLFNIGAGVASSVLGYVLADLAMNAINPTSDPNIPNVDDPYDDRRGIDGGHGPEPQPQPKPAPIIPGGPNDPPKTLIDTCTLDPDTPDTLYLYQRTWQAEEILSTGVRSPSGVGLTWLTSTRFSSGAAAQAALALPGEAPTGFFEVPLDRLPYLCGPFEVEPNFGQPGGGNEYWTTRDIDMGGLAWHPIP